MWNVRSDISEWKFTPLLIKNLKEEESIKVAFAWVRTIP